MNPSSSKESQPPEYQTTLEDKEQETNGTMAQEDTEAEIPGNSTGEMDEMRQRFLDSMEMARGRVKEILSKIWKLEGSWRMKTMKQGIWGIFFENEADKKEVLKKRPWLVNGALLNIREWPEDGCWEKVDMNKARYWVEAHGLPTPYLTWENTDVIARKVGEYIDFDRATRTTIARRGFLKFQVDILLNQRLVAGFYLNISRDRKEWVQFKYHKLPAVCFTCGHLAHSYGKCDRPMEYAYPPVGKAVPLYGAWIKVGVPIRSCFDPAIPRMKVIDVVRRSEIGEPVGTRNKGKSVITGVESDCTRSLMQSTRQQGAVGRTPSPNRVISQGAKKACIEKLWKEASLGNESQLRQGLRLSQRSRTHPMTNIDNRRRDEGIIASLMADIGPTRDQMVELPHEKICKSRVPHQHPEPTYVTWPTNSNLEEVIHQVLDPAQSKELGPNQIVVSHENTNFSTSGVSFSGAKKRKATVTIVPVITNGEEVEALGEKTPSTPITMLPQLDINTFVPGSSSREETSKRRSYNRKRGGTSSGGRRGARQNGKAPVKRLGIEFREELNAVKKEFGKWLECWVINLHRLFQRSNRGGFALLWNGTIELEVLQASGGVFEVLIKESITSSKWCMFAVYGRPYDNEKRGFWDWMEDKINKCSLPWMVIGDLNLIAHPWEKCGGRKASTSDTGILQSFLQNTGGVDLGYRGCKFTWQNNRFSSGFTRERLDRAIVSGDWITAFPEAMVTNAPISVSDHALRKWKNGAFGDCESLIKEAETRLGWIQEQPVSSNLLQEESALLSKITELWIRKESMWRQKSREIWLKVGDRNSKFFHASTVIRRRRNGITAIKNTVGGWETKTHRMGTVFNDFFGELYKAEGTTLDDDFYDLFSPLVTVEENTMLKGIPSHEEVWNAVASMHPLKAPGPDGMPGFFYRRYWEIVGNDVIRMVQNFFSTGTLEKQLNYTFICLIPKEESACTVDKFRPISLCNFAYKIISKIIATRLRGVIDKLITPFQSAFVPGRWIAESSILTQELVHTIKRKKGKGGLMAIKLDMLKAYDRIEWHFLHERRSKGDGARISLSRSGPWDIDRAIRKFWWSGKVEKDRYLALASWEKLCKPTVQGGLGFRKLEDMNKALLAKLAWQFVSKEDRPWELDYNITRLPFRTNDTIVWKEASDGRFTVKRGYEANLGDSSCEDGKLWKKVWGKEIHFRHSVMIWRVIMGCIPTRDRLSFITGKNCLLCDGACESAIHIFWECHCARALWFSSPFPICCENGSAISVKEWLVWALERIPMELNDQFLCFTGCLFEGIWKARNNLLFKGKLVDIATVRESILRRYNEYLLLATTKEITEIKRVSIRPAVTNGSGWDNATDVFCMTDASWKDGRAGIAVGLLDRRQGKTFWFAKFLQSSSPAEAELLAIKWAMELAAERGCQSFAGASDAKVLIEALVARQCPPLWKLKSLALEFLNLCNSFNLCNFFYVKRVDNSACDAMGRWARINAHCNGFLCREGSPFVILNYLFQ
uniref:Reverse transcriptase n=1 Tax=Cannabis sativa TaxID=3483 RepID=A0A803QNY7_CANSA